MKSEGAGFAERILETAVSLFGLIILCFVLLKLLPGSPFDEEIAVHPAVRESLQASWGLDQPVHMQLFSYIRALMSGDWGVSVVRPQHTVLSILGQGFANTAILNFAALVLIYMLAFSSAVSVHIASRPWWNRVYDGAISVFVSMPTFLLAPVLVWFLGIKLDLFPVAFLDTPRGYVLPLLALSLRPAAFLSRLIYESLATIRKDDFIRTAKAKGLSPARVIVRHALKNSLAPVFGHSSALVIGVLSGSFIVEVLFAVQGLGQIFVDALGERDVTVVVGLSFFYGLSLILLSLFFDILQRVVDPRLRDVS